jgi:hypothetical protein
MICLYGSDCSTAAMASGTSAAGTGLSPRAIGVAVRRRRCDLTRLRQTPASLYK